MAVRGGGGHSWGCFRVPSCNKHQCSGPETGAEMIKVQVDPKKGIVIEGGLNLEAEALNSMLR